MQNECQAGCSMFLSRSDNMGLLKEIFKGKDHFGANGIKLGYPMKIENGLSDDCNMEKINYLLQI